MRAIKDERARQVEAAVGDVRRIITQSGVNRESLARVKDVLLQLSKRAELFAFKEFPAPETDTHRYRLSEDDDHRFALYAVSGRAGKLTPPHNHTTWAVIVGVHGAERNRIYVRADDGSEPGKGELKQIDEVVIRPGGGITFMPDDIHSIQIDGEKPTLMLHMYGLALEKLNERVSYDIEAGTYAHFPLDAATK
jgi:predicted metal-dependent enzyme (double-stranded beta helix superfamily)